MNKFIIVVLLCLAEPIFSQTVTVIDKATLLPVSNVFVYCSNSKITAITDMKGQANISHFKDVDSLFFRHISYETKEISLHQLKLIDYIVELSEKNFVLNEFLVLSDRWEENKIETPNRIEKINIREVAFQNPQTSADLLGISGYAFIQKSQLGGGSPMLRGFATNRVLLVVDGVRMNTAIFRSGNLQNVISLDANAIESTEIIFGPVSVLYGSDAIGGVMDFKTLKTKFLHDTEKKLSITGNSFMRFSTANSEKTGHLDFNIGMKKLALITSFTSADYGDLRSGSIGGDHSFYRTYYVQTIDNKDYMVKNNDSTLQVGSKYSQINFMQKISFNPNVKWEFDYGFHFSQTSEYNRYDRLYVMQTSGPYKNKLRWAEWYYGPQKWQMNRLGATYFANNRFFDKAEMVAAYQFFEESRHNREFMFRELRSQREQVYAYSVNLDFNKKITNNMKLNYGTEGVFNNVHSVAYLSDIITKEVTPIATRYPDGSTWESYGAYANLNYKISEKFGLNGGTRYSYYQIKAVFDTTFFPFPFTNTLMKNDDINGSIGFIYTPYKSWQMYLNGATGFRSPNIDDMGKVFESTPGYLVVPNPDLKPEKVYNAEFGTVKTFRKFCRFDFTAYYTILKHGMVRKNFTLNGDTTIRYLGNKSRIQAVQNVTKIRVYGIQAGVEFFYKGFELISKISYQNGKEQTPDSLVYYPLRHAAPTFGSTHLTYEHKKFKAEFYVVYNAKMDYEDLDLTQRLNPSYARDENGYVYVAAWYTLNFKTAINFNQYVTLTAGVENITDRLYRPYSCGINAPGRNYIFSLKTRF